MELTMSASFLLCWDGQMMKWDRGHLVTDKVMWTAVLSQCLGSLYPIAVMCAQKCTGAGLFLPLPD